MLLISKVNYQKSLIQFNKYLHVTTYIHLNNKPSYLLANIVHSHNYCCSPNELIIKDTLQHLFDPMFQLRKNLVQFPFLQFFLLLKQKLIVDSLERHPVIVTTDCIHIRLSKVSKVSIPK